MFDLPEAKRVRREDLDSDASSRAESPDQDALELFRARGVEFEIASPGPEQRGLLGTRGDGSNKEVQEEEEAEFNLFARRPGGDITTTTKIQLRSPSPEDDGGSFARGKPLAYYLAQPLTHEQKLHYQIAAMTGAEVRRRATAYWPGSSQSWRVRVSQASSDHTLDFKDMSTIPRGISSISKRKRLGKKGRIKIRKRKASEAERKMKEKAAAEDRERSEREKKARRNREKKFKKRARDKLKKQSATAECAQSAGDGSVDSGEK